jgi:hypothetical protein
MNIQFQDTSVPWQAYKNCVAGLDTGSHRITLDGYDESPTGYEWATTTTLTAESFILLWQTSLDECEFVGRLSRLQEENPTFRMWSWNRRANRYRKKGIDLKLFDNSTIKAKRKQRDLEKLKKLANNS